VHVNNTEWLIRQLAADLVKHISLQSLCIYNSCCTPFKSTSVPNQWNRSNTNFKTASPKDTIGIYIARALI